MGKKSEKMPLRIVILQRGWVFVGRLDTSNEAEHLLRDAKCIRRWGTSAGLGQLAADGPQPETVLDPSGKVRFHPLTVVAVIDCDESKWAL